MTTATLTSKGQITIPAQVRASLGLGTGDRIEFIALGDGKFAIMAATHSARDLKGLIRKPSKYVSVEDMNQAIAVQGSKAI
jgi:antitoxin PrlF